MTGMSLQQYPRIDFYRKFEKKYLNILGKRILLQLFAINLFRMQNKDGTHLLLENPIPIKKYICAKL